MSKQNWRSHNFKSLKGFDLAKFKFYLAWTRPLAENYGS